MTRFTDRSIAATAALIATAATIGFATPSFAQSVSRTVAYTDLDLSTPAGEAVLARRIHRAVKAVCGPLDLANRAAVLDCRERAQETAQANARIAGIRLDRKAVTIASAR